MNVTLNISGMSCPHCVRHVTNALKDLSGVSEAVVSLEKNTAEVEHDGSVTFAVMQAAVEEAGYEAAEAWQKFA